jgi:hypothetical protein
VWSMQGSSRTWPLPETHFVGHAHFVVGLMRSVCKDAGHCTPQAYCETFGLLVSEGGKGEGAFRHARRTEWFQGMASNVVLPVSV